MTTGSIASLPPAAPAAPVLWNRSGFRALFLVSAMAALAGGTWGALWRLGWTLPHGSSLADLHGPLMICGLFGTLIGLERAVALGRGWSYAAPALAGLGTLLLLGGAPAAFGAGAYAAAAAVLAGSSLLIALRQPALFTGALLFGTLAWLAGSAVWMAGRPVSDAVGWWLTFLVLTVAGERLELSRVALPERRSEPLFLFGIGLLLAGAQNGLTTGNGAVLFGLGLIAATAWLLRHDVARRNIRRDGQTRFMAACMLAGHGWLGLAGLALLAAPPGETAFGYDIALHAVLIGFVLSMVFGHALIILPAVARVRVRYAPVLYGPLLLLHASLVLRVAAGLGGWDAGRRASGVLTLLALAGFAGSLAFASWRGRTRSRPAVGATVASAPLEARPQAGE
ncbi:hypothetical protein [Microvirga thermotolerans]|uniref:hypothetical protein n=1 Tax=Microvirga thermotolerans TaxID=2651334 RepID=UPI001883AC20|nr:hypothetical protein [Microvirga thermotolerans]